MPDAITMHRVLMPIMGDMNK